MQSHYVKVILRKFNAYDTTPMDLRLHLTKNHGEPISQLECSRIIFLPLEVERCHRNPLNKLYSSIDYGIEIYSFR